MSAESIDQLVRSRYGAIARKVLDQGENPGCGSGGGCGCEVDDLVSGDLYDGAQVADLPPQAVLASLGCGNPTALAELIPGQTVLDLGSGGGVDVLLSARRVGPTGRAIGIDFTDEMLELARNNQRAAGVTNVEFLKGSIEDIPLPDNSVDVVISNCVINLSGDKARVLAEAFRVLRPGGRLAISDVVAREPVSDAVRRSAELWVGCIGGAIDQAEYLQLLEGAGFADATLEPTRIYEITDPVAFAKSANVDEVVVRQVSGCFMGAFVRAVKPA